MDLTKEQIVEIIKTATENRIEVNVDQSSELLEDLGFDSLDSSTIYLELEESFDLEFEDDEVEKMKTVDSIFDIVKRKL